MPLRVSYTFAVDQTDNRFTPVGNCVEASGSQVIGVASPAAADIAAAINAAATDMIAQLTAQVLAIASPNPAG